MFRWAYVGALMFRSFQGSELGYGVVRIRAMRLQGFGLRTRGLQALEVLRFVVFCIVVGCRLGLTRAVRTLKSCMFCKKVA